MSAPSRTPGGAPVRDFSSQTISQKEYNSTGAQRGHSKGPSLLSAGIRSCDAVNSVNLSEGPPLYVKFKVKRS